MSSHDTLDIYERTELLKGNQKKQRERAIFNKLCCCSWSTIFIVGTIISISVLCAGYYKGYNELKDAKDDVSTELLNLKNSILEMKKYGEILNQTIYNKTQEYNTSTNNQFKQMNDTQYFLYNQIVGFLSGNVSQITLTFGLVNGRLDILNTTTQQENTIINQQDVWLKDLYNKTLKLDNRTSSLEVRTSSLETRTSNLEVWANITQSNISTVFNLATGLQTALNTVNGSVVYIQQTLPIINSSVVFVQNTANSLNASIQVVATMNSTVQNQGQLILGVQTGLNNLYGQYNSTVIILTGTQSNISDLQSRMVISETKIGGIQSNVSIIQITLLGTQSNVSTLQITLSGTQLNVSNVQGRMTTAEGNILTIQGQIPNFVLLSGTQTLTGSYTFTGLLTMNGAFVLNGIFSAPLSSSSIQVYALSLTKTGTGTGDIQTSLSSLLTTSSSNALTVGYLNGNMTNLNWNLYKPSTQFITYSWGYYSNGINNQYSSYVYFNQTHYIYNMPNFNFYTSTSTTTSIYSNGNVFQNWSPSVNCVVYNMTVFEGGVSTPAKFQVDTSGNANIFKTDLAGNTVAWTLSQYITTPNFIASCPSGRALQTVDYINLENQVFNQGKNQTWLYPTNGVYFPSNAGTIQAFDYLEVSTSFSYTISCGGTTSSSYTAYFTKIKNKVDVWFNGGSITCPSTGGSWNVIYLNGFGSLSRIFPYSIGTQIYLTYNTVPTMYPLTFYTPNNLVSISGTFANSATISFTIQTIPTSISYTMN